MSEPKPGEQINLAIQQIDAEDRIIMDLGVKWYGFENDAANQMVNSLIDAIQERTLHFSQVKNA